MSERGKRGKVVGWKKPRSEAGWAAYRCGLSCRIGRDALEGKVAPPAGCSALEFAVFNLLHAVEDLAKMNNPDNKS